MGSAIPPSQSRDDAENSAKFPMERKKPAQLPQKLAGAKVGAYQHALKHPQQAMAAIRGK
jgi:hypothetical protein